MLTTVTCASQVARTKVETNHLIAALTAIGLAAVLMMVAASQFGIGFDGSVVAASTGNVGASRVLLSGGQVMPCGTPHTCAAKAALYG